MTVHINEEARAKKILEIKNYIYTDIANLLASKFPNCGYETTNTRLGSEVYFEIQFRNVTFLLRLETVSISKDGVDMNDDYIVTYYHNDNLSNGTFIHENQEKKIFALNEIEYLERYINSITY